MRLVRSEAFKLRTTRTFYGVVGGALALVLVISIVAAAAASFKGGDEPVRDLLGVASLAQFFALVLGILAVSTELRHGTITPTLLAVPDRSRLVLAKAIAYTAAGLALGVVAFAASAVLVAVITSSRGVGLTTRRLIDLELVEPAPARRRLILHLRAVAERRRSHEHVFP